MPFTAQPCMKSQPDTDQTAEQEELRPSKSQLKREADAILDFARTLGEIPEAELAQIDLPEDIDVAVQHLRQISARSAGKRQLHYLAKLLRNHKEHLPEWRAASEKARLPAQLETQAFHNTERWRSRLLNPAPEKRKMAITDFKNQQPSADIQQLRQLIRNHDQQHSDDGRKRVARELFRWLRDASKPESE